MCVVFVLGSSKLSAGVNTLDFGLCMLIHRRGTQWYDPLFIVKGSDDRQIFFTALVRVCVRSLLSLRCASHYYLFLLGR